MPVSGARRRGRKPLRNEDVRREVWAVGAICLQDRSVAISTGVALAAENNDLSEGERIGVSNGQQCRKAADRSEALRGAAMQRQLRRSPAPDHFDVAPQDPERMAGAKRFHRRLFCGKPAGKVNRRHPPASAIRHFAFGKYASQKPLAVPLDSIGDAIDIRGVQSEPDNVRHETAPA